MYMYLGPFGNAPACAKRQKPIQVLESFGSHDAKCSDKLRESLPFDDADS